MRMSFDQAVNIRKILLSLTGPTFQIRVSPDFALQDIFQDCHLHFVSHDLLELGSRNEIVALIARICLQLNSQFRFCAIETHPVFEPSDRKLIPKLGDKCFDSICGNDDIQVKTNIVRTGGARESLIEEQTLALPEHEIHALFAASGGRLVGTSCVFTTEICRLLKLFLYYTNLNLSPSLVWPLACIWGTFSSFGFLLSTPSDLSSSSSIHAHFTIKSLC